MIMNFLNKILEELSTAEAFLGGIAIGGVALALFQLWWA